jgi:hypothetical protein
MAPIIASAAWLSSREPGRSRDTRGPSGPPDQFVNTGGCQVGSSTAYTLRLTRIARIGSWLQARRATLSLSERWVAFDERADSRNSDERIHRDLRTSG